MTKFSPIFGWPIAEDTDVVKQYPSTVDDPFKTMLEADLGFMGAWATASGELTGMATGNVPVPMTQIVNYTPGFDYVLTGEGIFQVPADGKYLLFTHGHMSGGTNNGAMLIRNTVDAQERGFRLNFATTATVNAGAGGGLPVVYRLTAGQTTHGVLASAAVAGTTVNAYQTIIYLGPLESGVAI